MSLNLQPKVQFDYISKTIEGTEQKKELPFVVGILDDFSGNHSVNESIVSKFNFITIDYNNFNKVMKCAIKPKLTFEINNVVYRLDKGIINALIKEETVTDDVVFDIKLYINSKKEKHIEVLHKHRFLKIIKNILKEKFTDDIKNVILNHACLKKNTSIDLKLESIKDFHPDFLIENIKPLNLLYKKRNRLYELKKRLGFNKKLDEWLNIILKESNIKDKLFKEADIFQNEKYLDFEEVDLIINQIIRECRLDREENQKEDAILLIKEFLLLVVDNPEITSESKYSIIDQNILELDMSISNQLKQILNNSNFQKLESSWRGIHYLVSNIPASNNIKIKILNISKQEFAEDLTHSYEINQTYLFKSIYTKGLNTWGGDPFAILLCGYEFGYKDIKLLEIMSKISAISYCPFISAASPDLFNLDNFTEINNIPDLENIFDVKEYTRLNNFRMSEESMYVALTLPRFLLRLPYGLRNPINKIDFEELNGNENFDDRRFLWGNSSYALGKCIVTAFYQYGWCANIEGVETGGLIESLPIHYYQTEWNETHLKSPTEISIPDKREYELSQLGFTPLLYCNGSDYGAFFSVNTLYKPTNLSKNENDIYNLQLYSRLKYILITCRIAHYCKSIIKENVGSLVTKEQLIQYLNNWIQRYVNKNSNADINVKAKYPFRDAKIDIDTNTENSNYYKIIILISPHFQFNFSVTLRLCLKVYFNNMNLSKHNKNINSKNKSELYSMEPSGTLNKIFISYSHKDTVWKDKFTKHLNVLQKQNILDIWEDSNIQPGDDWFKEIQKSLRLAKLAILLVSVDFLNSKFINSIEVPSLLKKRQDQGLKIIPVILKYCPWQHISWLKDMKVLPKDGKPLSTYDSNKQDEIIVNLVEQIANSCGVGDFDVVDVGGVRGKP